jgi:hypothetical protein
VANLCENLSGYYCRRLVLSLLSRWLDGSSGAQLSSFIRTQRLMVRLAAFFMLLLFLLLSFVYFRSSW